ncbi:hypothetical protein E3T43_07225 [Cryobacterium sp. Hh7]|uniref:tape measure protein n=1 Tax=Cryobacterium sp. Hh7 TaxID=1259159 RepID=UPI00106DA949|nr:tape measure protein [Cryobacterium sp. Hh7]TFD58032.1 hypothetical protein E3T43_07225 [Cryobacterium sp. Hh7]
MSTVGTADVAIFPSFKNFRTTVVSEVDATASDSGSRFSNVFSNAVKGIGAGIAVGVGAAIAGIAAVAGAGLSRSLNLQDAKAQLTGLGHSAETVSQIMDNALVAVEGTAFRLDAAAGLAASAVAAGIKPGEALTRTLRLTADAATIGKASLSEMGDMVNKVATNGKLTTEVLQQFQTRQIPLLQLVANEYGVTTEAASEMVTKGEVDFARFQSALEAGVGGAALSSGATARGAWANVGAAWSKLGAMFVGSAVDGAPVLFTAISGAVKRLTVALTPLSEQFSGKMTPAIAAFAGWIDTIDFSKIIGGFQGVYDLVAKGDFTTGLRNAFNIEEDNPVVNVILTIRDGITGLYALLVNGDFTGAMHRAFNVEEDSPVIGFLLDLRTAVGDFFSEVGAAFSTGDFSTIWDSFGSIGATLSPLMPVFAAVAEGIGAIAGTVGAMISAGIGALVPIIEAFTGALVWLGDHSEIIAPLIIGIAAAFVIYKTAQTASNVASLLSLPIQAAQLATSTLNSAALFTMAAATRGATAAQGTANIVNRAATPPLLSANAQLLLGTGHKIRSAVVTGALAVKTGVLAVAHGVATAAQWALNAAMTANPIALIVIAIAALVAGLIWFFTQTELGQEIWANFSRFLTEAWANIQLVATATFTALAAFFSDTWTNIQAATVAVFDAIIQFFTDTWANITGMFSTAIAFLLDLFFKFHPLGIIIAHFDEIVAFLAGFWRGVQDTFAIAFAFLLDLFLRFTPLGLVITNFDKIVAFFFGFWEGLKAAFGAAVAFLLDLFLRFTPLGILISNWGKITAFFGTAMSHIGSSVSTGIDSAIGFFRDLPGRVLGALGNMGNFLLDAGKDLMGGFIDGIESMLGGIGDAVGNAMDFVADFFPHSPAKRGQFSGSGWRKVLEAGQAVGDQFGAGLTAAEPSLTAKLGSMVNAKAFSPRVDTSALTTTSSERDIKLTYNNFATPGLSSAEELFKLGPQLKARTR